MTYNDVLLASFMDELTKLAQPVDPTTLGATLGANLKASPASNFLSANKRGLGLLVAGGAGTLLAQNAYGKYKLGNDMMKAQREQEEARQG